MRDTFDFRQAYLEFHKAPLSLFAGRQELRFGEERLIGISDWPNVGRTFDVIDARLGAGNNRVDLFSGGVVPIFPTSLDRPLDGFYLHGIYGTLKTLLPRTRLEPFVLLKTPVVISRQGNRGREVMVAPGIRAVGHLPAGFDYDVQGVIERGSYSNDSIHAGGAYIKAGYGANFVPWKPHLELEYDYASGNSNRNPLRVSTFDQFYPSDHNVFGLTDLFGWQNIKQRRLNFGLLPTKKLYILLQGESLHVASTNDSVYNGAGAISVRPPSGGFRSDDIGSELDASMRYASRYHLLFEIGIGHFWPGALMKQNQHGAPQTLSYFQVTYYLKLDNRLNTQPSK